MSIAKTFLARIDQLIVIVGLCMCCAQAHTAPQWVECAPVHVATFQGRIHVRCQDAVAPSISFFALSTADAPFAQRTLGVGVAAFVSGKGLSILMDPADLSGQAIGCLNSDCRLIQALVIRDPVVPARPPTQPTPLPRAQCLSACESARNACKQIPHVPPASCDAAAAQCIANCPP